MNFIVHLQEKSASAASASAAAAAAAAFDAFADHQPPPPPFQPPPPPPRPHPAAPPSLPTPPPPIPPPSPSPPQPLPQREPNAANPKGLDVRLSIAVARARPNPEESAWSKSSVPGLAVHSAAVCRRRPAAGTVGCKHNLLGFGQQPEKGGPVKMRLVFEGQDLCSCLS